MLARPIILLAASILCAGMAIAQSVDIEYVDGLGGEWRTAVRAAIPDFEPARSLLEARRQARISGLRVSDALNAQGYFDPRIDTAVTDEDPPRPRLRVDPGARFAVGAVTIAFDGPPPRPEDVQGLDAALIVAAGDLAIPERIISAERALVAQLRSRGYPDATAGPREIVGDRDQAEVDITYRLFAGPRVQFGRIDLPADLRTSPDYLDTLLPVSPGEIYTPEALTLFNRRLVQTRLFTRATARLSDQPAGTDPETGNEIRDIIVELEERPRHTLALGGRYSTSEGYGATGQLVRRNLTRSGDDLQIELNLSELTRAIDIDWNRPNEFGYGRGIVLSASLSDDTTDAFDSRTVGLGAVLNVVESPQVAWSVGVSGETIVETLPLEQERTVQVAAVTGGVRLDHANDLLDPTQGWRADARISPTYVFGDESTKYVGLTGQVSGYLPFGEGDRFVLASRLRLGSILGAGLLDLPSDQRFYAGGGGSVRGFAYQGIGPTTRDGTPIGGRSLSEVSLEARWRRSQRLGFVAFLDGGAISREAEPEFDDMRFGAGIGVRYGTPAGPVRFDIALPVNRREGDDPFQVYISIGQAF